MKKILLLSSLIFTMILSLAVHDAHAQYPWLGVYGGGTFPTGNFSDIAGNGYGVGFGIGSFVNPNILLKAMASYHSFGAKTVFGQELEGAYAPLEHGANFYLGYPGGIRPYLDVHGGWFVASGDFKDSEYGMGVGLGLEIPLGGPTTALFIEPGYNIIFHDVKEEYWTINVGFTFTFAPPSPIKK